MKDNRQTLQKVQLKVTHAREEVLDFFLKQKHPVSADAIVLHLAKKQCNTDKATVYRILEAFYKKGIINKMEFGEGKFRYELSGSDHHHLICENCGNIEDISDCNIDVLEKEIKRKKQFLVKRHSLEFYGLCRKCQEEKN